MRLSRGPSGSPIRIDSVRRSLVGLQEELGDLARGGSPAGGGERAGEKVGGLEAEIGEEGSRVAREVGALSRRVEELCSLLAGEEGSGWRRSDRAAVPHLAGRPA